LPVGGDVLGSAEGVVASDRGRVVLGIVTRAHDGWI